MNKYSMLWNVRLKQRMKQGYQQFSSENIKFSHYQSVLSPHIISFLIRIQLPKTNMTQTTLIFNKLCPFARKAIISLKQKNVDFKVVEEDFFNKTEFFKETYAKALGRVPGKDGVVPVLIDGQIILSESEPITWYVAEKFANQGNSLIPANHTERFKMRLFIEEFVKKIIGLQGKLFGWSKKSEEDKQKLIQESTQIFQKLNNQLVLPYAIGEEFTLADILIQSHLEIIAAVEHYTTLGISEKYEKIHRLLEELQKRKSFSEVSQPKEVYIQAFQKFF